MATRLKINDVQIKALKPQDKTYSKHFGGGFTVKVYPNGRKVVYYVYQHQSKRRSYQLGEYGTGALTLAQLKDEYSAARGARKSVARIDPAAEREKAIQQQKRDDRIARSKKYTVKHLADDFIQHYKTTGDDKLKPLTRKEYQRNLNYDVLPVLGDVPVEEVTRIQLKTLIENKALSALSMSNRTLAVLTAMFGWWAYRTENDNPALGIRKSGKEKARERALTADEVRIFWQALENIRLRHGNMLKLVLLSGQRPGEVAGMRWDELDLDNPNGAVWVLPGTRVKTGQEHRIPITDMMKQLLPTQGDSPLVFPSRNPSKPMRTLVRLITSATNGTPLESSGIDDPIHFTAHDLRRTCATHLGHLGYLDEEIGLILNHARHGTTQRYNRARYDERKRKMLEHWHQRLTTILAGKIEANVTQIRNEGRA